MKTKIIILIFLLPITLMNCKQKNKQEESKESIELPTAEVFFSSDTIRPGNMAITSTGRIFVTSNPLFGDHIAVREIDFETKESKPYPNMAYVSGANAPFGIGIGIKVDSKDNIWLLEMKKGEIHIFDTKNDKLLKVIKLGKETFLPNSFLQDFVIDEKRNRVIIADMTTPVEGMPAKPAFIVLDLNSMESARILENNQYLLGDNEAGGLNPIEIDDNGEWIYFGAMISSKMYRAKAEAFNDPKALIGSIELVATNRDWADGMKYFKNEILYIGDVKDHVIGKLEKGVYTEVAKLPDGQKWPDGFSIYQGFLYCTVNQLNESASFMDNTEDTSKPPYTIVRIKL